ncbi:putative glycoside hydrolase family 15 protein [bacterium]|nr:putative glycoside hydrolase family 15 protein [bacterium]
MDKNKKRFILTGFIFLPLLVFILLTSFLKTAAQTLKESKSVKLEHGFPRIVYAVQVFNYTEENLKKIASYDILVIGDIVQDERPEIFDKLRQFNPTIKILAYVDPIEIHESAKKQEKHTIAYQRYKRVPDSWWLKDSFGFQAKAFKDQWLVDVTNKCSLDQGERWNTFLPKFIHQRVMSVGCWDGIMFDNCWKNVTSQVRNIDQNKDGKKDDPIQLNKEWAEGMETLLNCTRNNETTDKFILSNVEFFSPVNGIVIEDMDNYDWHKSWENVVNKYHYVMKNAVFPQVCFLQVAIYEDELSTYRKVRFGLTTTLLNNGYFCVSQMLHRDQIVYDPGKIWFDEFGGIKGLKRGYLGNPKTAAYLYEDQVWRRDFDHGIVLCNPSYKAKFVHLETIYKKIDGQQDRRVNDGSLVSAVTIPPQDGLILLRKPNNSKQSDK